MPAFDNHSVDEEDIPDTERDPAVTLAERASLHRALEDLGPDEITVLTRIAERLAMGADTYGPLEIARDDRDFRKEAREEVEDALVYLACAWLKAEEEGE
jgi:hypothetical protein